MKTMSIWDVTLDNIITYDRAIGDHNFNVTLVSGFEHIQAQSFEAKGTGYDNLTLSYYALQAGSLQEIFSDGWEEQYLYQTGRINYNFRNKYFFTATLRKDGFSGFAKNKKTGYFPSVGLGWLMSKEKILKDITFINRLKLRASYGVNGNIPSRYSSLSKVEQMPNYIFGSETALGQYPTTLPNDELSWETTKSLNFGLDFSIFNNRISGDINYYRSTTTDLLWDLSTPQITGFSSIISNLGEISNRGFEMSLSAGIIKSSTFNWTMDIFFDKNNNKIETLIGLDNDNDGKEDDLIASKLFIGRSIGTVYDLEIDRIYQLSDLGNIPEGYDVGFYKYTDVNDDGLISAAEDRKILGKEEPAYSFGIQNTLSYKNFAFKFFIKSIQGGKNGYLMSNEPDHRNGNYFGPNNWYHGIDRWSPTNTDGRYMTLGGTPVYRAQINGGGNYLPRSFVRLQDISLSYTFNKNELMQKLGIGDLKVYMSGKNLLTITKWPGWDPEAGQGLDYGGYPVMKGFTAGLEIKF